MPMAMAAEREELAELAQVNIEGLKEFALHAGAARPA